jgi:hypothetical protein
VFSSHYLARYSPYRGIQILITMRNLIVLAILACVAFMSCKSNSSEVATQARQQQYMIDSLKGEMTKKQVMDSVAQALASQPVALAPACL